jgi:hypothetical protein
MSSRIRPLRTSSSLLESQWPSLRHQTPLQARPPILESTALSQHSIHLLQAYSCSHIPKTHQLPTRLRSLCPCLQACLETRYTPRQTVLASLSVLLHHAVDDIAKIVVEALFHADGELVLSYTLGASSAEDVSHDDFELAKRAGGLRTVFKGDV